MIVRLLNLTINAVLGGVTLVAIVWMVKWLKMRLKK